MEEAMNLTLFPFISFLFLLLGNCEPLPVIEDDALQTYIVHLHKPGDTKLSAATDLHQWHSSFLPNTTLDSGEPRLLHSYSTAITGFAARLTLGEVTAMANMNGFVGAQLDRRMQLHTTYTPEFLGLNDWSATWGESLYGEGTVIGVLDTGVLPSHPSFADNGMPPPPVGWKGHCSLPHCNNKIIGAISFLGASQQSALDTDGHGTHVAGIVAGNFNDADVLGLAGGLASGTAPKAHLAIYKVCAEEGCDDSNVLAGIDQAIRDRVDVLAMPFGPDFPRSISQDSVAVATLAAVKNGIVVCGSAGNLGPRKNIISHEAPWILTVGASSTDRRIRVTVKLGNGMEMDGESAYQPSEEDTSSGFLPIVFPGINGDVAGLNCYRGSLDDIDARGKIVLCYSGGGAEKNTQKSDVVKYAGGAAMLLMNHQGEGFSTSAEAHSLPVSHLSYIDGRKIRSYVYSSMNATSTAAIFFKKTVFGAGRSPAVASFSSRGPSLMNGGILKPDIIAPGVNILSAWPSETETSVFRFQSGTSMAAAHVSGIVALIKSKHPRWSPAAIQSAIMTSATAIDLDGSPIFDQSSYNKSADLFARGAGLVNPAGAMDPGLIYDIHHNDYVSYICGVKDIDSQVSVVHHRGSVHCNSSIDAEQLNYPSISVSLGFTSPKTVTRTVTNVGEANSVYLSRIVEPDGVRVYLSQYRLPFSRTNQEKSFDIHFSVKESHHHQIKGHVSEGLLSWISDKHVVSSPISVRFN